MDAMTPDLRARADARDRLLASRLDSLIPMLMDRAGLDAWVLAAREYNEDPVLQTMLPATWLDTARRRTILLFLRSSDRVRRMAVARYAVGDAFPSAWDPEAQPDQWSRLAELLAEADPERDRRQLVTRCSRWRTACRPPSGRSSSITSPRRWRHGS